MRLYIVRHGIAFPHGTPGMAEDDRPLTKEGIRKMQQTAKGLRAIDCVPDVILSSPLPRARQTAEIVLEALGKRFPLILIDALAPAGNRQDVYREIRKRQDSQSLMLVWPQIMVLVGLVLLLFTLSYIRFMREEIRA